MADQISRLMGERVEVAKSLLPLAFEALLAHVHSAYQTEMKRLGLESDPEAARDYVSATIERDLLLAFRGYADWLAALVWRDSIARNVTLPARFELPVLTMERIEALSRQVDADPEMFRWLQHHLAGTQVTLPGLGVVGRGVIEVDRDALREWASCFDWTIDGHQAPT